MYIYRGWPGKPLLIMGVYNKDLNRINVFLKLQEEEREYLLDLCGGDDFLNSAMAKKVKKINRFTFLVFKKFWKTNSLKFCRR